MHYIYLLVAIIISAYGLFLWVQAFLWRSNTAYAEGEIIGFLKNKSRGKKLPVLQFEDESAVEIQSKAIAIDSFSFWVRPAQKGEILDVIYFKKNPEKCVVHGYMNIVIGFFMQWPFIFYMSANYFSALAQGQFAFLFVLLCVVTAIWLFLRFVRFHYW